MKAKWELGLGGGLVVANPIPAERSMDPDTIDAAIAEALAQAEAAGIKGKEATPYLLAKVKELTEGESLESNIALVLNNAVLAARIAVEYAKMR
jgi:pseudouridine-5'-phosphate glycosidase